MTMWHRSTLKETKFFKMCNVHESLTQRFLFNQTYQVWVISDENFNAFQSPTINIITQCRNNMMECKIKRTLNGKKKKKSSVKNFQEMLMMVEGFMIVHFCVLGRGLCFVDNILFFLFYFFKIIRSVFVVYHDYNLYLYDWQKSVSCRGLHSSR